MNDHAEGIVAGVHRAMANKAHRESRECKNGNNVEGTMQIDFGGWARYEMADHYSRLYPAPRFCHDRELWSNRLPLEHVTPCLEGVW